MPPPLPLRGLQTFPRPSLRHHDLTSFLSYATQTKLPHTSPTYIGTHYEYTVLASLTRLGFSLTRVGGRADGGIDLLGTLTLPHPRSPSSSSSSSSSHAPLKTLIQCKSRKRRAGPATVRELEGAFAAAPPGWRGAGGVLACLATTRGATKGVREALGRSEAPLAFLMVEDGECGGAVRQMLWNRAAERVGLEGWAVGARYSGGAEVGEVEVGLVWKGGGGRGGE